jgi:hypothetical protein
MRITGPYEVRERGMIRIEGPQMEGCANILTIPEHEGESLRDCRTRAELACRILNAKEPMINALLSKYRAKDKIVLQQELCEETGKLVWRWTVPSLGLGGYCRSKRDARSDAKICINQAHHDNH